VADIERELAKVKRKRGYACLGRKAFKTIEPSGALFGRFVPWEIHDMVEQSQMARRLRAFAGIGIYGVQNVESYASLPKDTLKLGAFYFFGFPPGFERA
jgi:hypothetical protein